MNSLLRGAWSGVMATSTMTMAMFKSHKELPREEQSPLPPAILTDEVQRKTGVFPDASSEVKEQATLFSHFGYGALGGITYALLAKKIPTDSPLLKGTLFGLAVWAGSYYGLIPSLKLKPTAPEMTAKRNLMMIAAHIVWGTSLAFAEQELRKRSAPLLDGKKNPQRLQ
ncbi:DUF6789 family protein [Bdellovibrio sp. HCB2-146]|uniref:DUF6789 family protein n=1 Tax=Bdellovibrio sp. HCB2-146 TaxID=3394362 RepID=UPI0039BD022E